MSQKGDRSRVTPPQQAERISRVAMVAAALTGLICAFLFSVWPHLDLDFAGLFYEGHRRFVLVDRPLGTVPRNIFYALFIAFCITGVVGVARGLRLREQTLGLGFVQWLYIVVCVVTGPGLVANVGFKDHWGRARPSQVVEFGGEAAFTPPLLPSDACDRNCSFIGGESSSMFMMFFSLGMALPQYRGALMIGGVVAGLGAGLVRMGMGGHFLSDILFSGVFMALVAGLLHHLMLRRHAAFFEIDGPLHTKLADLLTRRY